MSELRKEVEQALDEGEIYDTYGARWGKERIDALRAALAQPEPTVKESLTTGTCIACGNRMTGLPEHFVVATASEGVTAPEGYSPQQVKALHQHKVGDKTSPPLADRIADVLVEDHIALMRENERLRAALAQPEKTNQCAETCERAKLCAVCARGLAEPGQEPFFTAANGFPQTFVSKDRQKNAVISLTEQCADLIRERDELQKQVWLYEKHGVTCQTYRHAVEQSCSECNVQMMYTAPPQRKPLTDQEVKVLWADVYEPEPHIWVIAERFARAMERAHGIE